jgi:MFS family permease
MQTNNIRYLIFASALFAFSRMFTGAIYVHELVKHGITIQDISIAKGLQLLVTALMTLPLGIFADRYGRKKSVILACSSATVSYGLLFWPSPLTLYASEMLSGLAIAFYSGAFEAWLSSEKDEINATDLAKVFSRSAESTFLAMLVAASIGAAFPSLSFHFSFACMALTTFFFANLPERSTKRPNSMTVAEVKHSLVSTLQTLKVAPALRWSAICSVFFIGFMQLLYQFWQPYFQQNFNIGAKELGIVFCSFMLAQFLLGRTLRTRVLPKVEAPRYLVGLCWIFGAVSLVVLMRMHDLFAAAAVFCLVQSFCASAQTFQGAVIASEVKDVQRATAFSVIDLSGRGLGFALMTLSPLLWALKGDKNFGWPVLAVVLALLGAATLVAEWRKQCQIKAAI